MTLDPVHFDSIAALVRSIGREVDDASYDDLAQRIWTDFLDPLLDPSGSAVIEPIEPQKRGVTAIPDCATIEPPFPTAHGVDAGTLNPTTFRNGVVLDIAQAVMASVPTDLDLHRSRSIVGTVHTGDATVRLVDDWVRYDAGYSRRRIFKAPRVDRFAGAVVHTLSLYRAEIEHAQWHASDVEDLLIFDGPVYPKALLRWDDLHPSLAKRLSEAVLPRRIIELYLRLIETMLEREVPIVGFVKNPQSKLITRTLRSTDGGFRPPWTDDTTFFTRVLDPGRFTHHDRSLRYTSWFLSRGGTDGPFAADGPILDIERKLPAMDYAVTFFVVYDPRDRVIYRIEAPYGFTREQEHREQITRYILSEVAINRGPPTAVAKADEIARIGLDEKTAIRRKIETEWDTTHVGNYDAIRWDLPTQ